MSKKLQRKKQLRNSLRRSGAFSTTVTKVVEETKKVVKHAEKSASEAGKVVWRYSRSLVFVQEGAVG